MRIKVKTEKELKSLPQYDPISNCLIFPQPEGGTYVFNSDMFRFCGRTFEAAFVNKKGMIRFTHINVMYYWFKEVLDITEEEYITLRVAAALNI